MSALPARPLVEIDWSRCVLPPFEHQRVGIRELIKWNDPARGRAIGGVFALLDEPGAGKTKQIVDPACFLTDAGEIDTVLVVTPASVRAVWASDFGEIEKHAWFPRTVAEYHAKTPRLPFEKGRLNWVVTNFDFIRSPERLVGLMNQLRGRRVWMVVDESIRIKSPKSAQTKACFRLGGLAVRRTILNGTPVGNNPLDLWAQFEFLDPRIIGAKNYFHFRAAYAVMGGYLGKQVLGFQRLEELQQRIAPYVLRRLKEDCLDLPAKSYTVREARLTPATWRIYKQMRDECIAFLDSPEAVAAAPQAVVRILRLSQITAGFLGGLENVGSEERPLFAPVGDPSVPREIGSEKLGVTLEAIEDLLETDEPRVRILVWCRFRAELARIASFIAQRWPHVAIGRIEGGQNELVRRNTVSEFQNESLQNAMVLLGNPQAGGLGLTLTAAHHVIYASNDFNLVTRLQSEDRVHRPGQHHPVLYTDVIATGPEGQRTIDHVIINALRKKQDLATWTTQAWRAALSE